MLSSANVINEAINPKLTFNIARDFAPVALVNTTADHPGGASLDRRERCQGADRARQVEARRVELRLDRRRHRAASVRRAARRSAPASRSSTCRTRAARRRRPICWPAASSMMFSPASAVVAQAKEGKLKVLATAHRQAARHPARPADHGGGRHAGLRDRDLVRPGGAGRHAAAGRSTSSPRRSAEATSRAGGRQGAGSRRASCRSRAAPTIRALTSPARPSAGARWLRRRG